MSAGRAFVKFCANAWAMGEEEDVIIAGWGCYLIRLPVVSVLIDNVIHRVIERECSMIVLKMVVVFF